MCNDFLCLRPVECESLFLIRKSIFFPPAIMAIVSVPPLRPDGKLEDVEMAMVCGELITGYMYVKEDNMGLPKKNVILGDCICILWNRAN